VIYVKKIPIYEDIATQQNFPFQINLNTIKDTYPLHRHDLYEISLVMEGYGRETINGREHILKPGTLSFLLPHQLHNFHNDGDSPIKLYSCMFDLDVIFPSKTDASLRAVLFDSSQPLSFIYLNEQQMILFNTIFRQIQQEYISNDIHRRSFIRAKLTECLISADRIRRDICNLVPNLEQYTINKSIWDIVHFTHTHYWDEITLQKICDQFQVSSISSLSHAFKEEVGQSFVQYLHEVRINRACSLLLSTDMSITEISTEVGYNSFKTFSRAFKYLKGTTPTNYRCVKL
jgi:AraC-like DNA-binding protein